MDETKEAERDNDDEEIDPKEQKRLGSVKAKEKGNVLYKAKKFDEAIAAYDEAIALNPTNMTFLSNKAAVYFTLKRYDDCITACTEAVEVGKNNRAPFEDRSKALFRCAKAYQKKGDLTNAIKMCENAQLEFHDDATLRFMKAMELEKGQAEIAYEDDEKAEKAKQLGNAHFRDKEWNEAIAAYQDAVKRAPKNAAIRNNLSAAFCKINDYNAAKREIEVALELDPKYVKAWANKADMELLLNDKHKAMDCYRKALRVDPSSKQCQEGLQKVEAQVLNITMEERKKNAAKALADPNVKEILKDPNIMQVLKNLTINPGAAQAAMMNPSIKSKIDRLIKAGVLHTA